jgi:hypothetical protein
VLCRHLPQAHQLLCLSSRATSMTAQTTCTVLHHLLANQWTAHHRHHRLIKTGPRLCLLLNHRHLLVRQHINLDSRLMSAVHQ